MSVSTSTAVPAPFSVAPTWSWDGDDGSWSTFEISVGSPEQSFRILPSTTGAETWVPYPPGCEGILSSFANCGTLRGVNDFEGKASRGFQTSSSSTWDQIGIYELATEQSLWGASDYTGLYGYDTVSLKSYESGQDATLSSQTVAGVATTDIWLGSLGLGTAEANFGVENGSKPSLLDALMKQIITPGLSFGYTAGSPYSSPKAPGSLILGGYDKARFKPSDISFPVVGDKKKTLPVSVESIIAENVFGGTRSLVHSPVVTSIDSTTSQLWLPQNICDLFAMAFGLKQDAYTGLYLVNSTTHRKLKQMNPTVTFTISGTDSGDSTTNIVLPYAAFDLQAGIPLFNYSMNYFPIRVAANESQQVLGRAFLQEAYIFVDWERNNFTIGQAVHQNSTTNIVSVLSLTHEPSHKQSSLLSTGAIVGIAVGAGAVLALVITIVGFLVIRRRRRASARAHYGNLPTEMESNAVKPPEIMSAHVYELQEGENSRHGLYAKQMSELQGDSSERDLEGEGISRDKKQEPFEMP